VDSELFDITYVQCGDPAVEKTIEEYITQFDSWVERHPGKRGQVCLSFYEKRKKQAWFTNKEERLYWEQWCFSFDIVASNHRLEEQNSFSLSAVRAQRNAKLQAAVEELLTIVVRTVNDKKEHIPPVVSAKVVTFPFDIIIVGEPGSSFGLDMVKRMLMHTSPPPSVLS
jgi:hypothetical protein